MKTHTKNMHKFSTIIILLLSISVGYNHLMYVVEGIDASENHSQQSTGTFHSVMGISVKGNVILIENR